MSIIKKRNLTVGVILLMLFFSILFVTKNSTGVNANASQTSTDSIDSFYSLSPTRFNLRLFLLPNVPLSLLTKLKKMFVFLKMQLSTVYSIP